MASVRQAKMKQKNLDRRKVFWPDVPDNEFYDKAKSPGFTSVPRTMPLIISIIDDLTTGKPAGLVYFELWMRTYEEMFVKLSDKEAHAFHCGYGGQRAVQTWKSRIKALENLGFILTAEGSTGMSNIAIPHPHIVIKRLFDKNQPGLVKRKYNALVEHGLDWSMKDVNWDPKVHGDLETYKADLSTLFATLPTLPGAPKKLP